jgi:uncharacterized protein YlzI (FlbEa/FlbD family)
MTNYLSKATLKSRGLWTESAISKFLGPADKEVKNPRYRRGPSMKLYSEERINLIEQTKEFYEFVLKSDVRRKGAMKAVETKTEKMKVYGSTFEINIPHFESIEALYEKVIQHHNTYIKSWINDQNSSIQERNSRHSKAHGYWINDEEIEFIPIDINSDKKVLNKSSVNYLRHQLTSYEKQLISHNKDNKGKVGKSEAYKAIKFRINNAIADKYPELREAVEEITFQTEKKVSEKEFYRKMRA